MSRSGRRCYMRLGLLRPWLRAPSPSNSKINSSIAYSGCRTPPSAVASLAAFFFSICFHRNCAILFCCLQPTLSSALIAACLFIHSALIATPIFSLDHYKLSLAKEWQKTQIPAETMEKQPLKIM